MFQGELAGSILLSSTCCNFCGQKFEDNQMEFLLYKLFLITCQGLFMFVFRASLSQSLH